MLNIKRTDIDTATVAITDYQMVNPTQLQAAQAGNKLLAKVIVSFTGRHNRETLTDAVGKLFANQAAVVENSFRQVRPGVAVGFVRANTEIYIPKSEQEVKANYKVMSSNILMDKKDQKLWEVREGMGGKYLARHGHEDLSELVKAAVHHRPDVPAIRHLAMASAARNEFVAFVSASGDMDYGFATGVRDDAVRVVSCTTMMNTVVPKECITASMDIAIPRDVHAQIVKAGIDPADKTQAKEYWTKLYSYAPAYLDMVKKQVDEGTTM